MVSITSQKLHRLVLKSFGSHAYSLGTEIGYQVFANEDKTFYFTPELELIGGIIQGADDINVVIGGKKVIENLLTTYGLSTGYIFKTKGGLSVDFRVGASLVEEITNVDTVKLSDEITTVFTGLQDDLKMVFNLGSNLVLADKWRVYFDVERSVLGRRNTTWQANGGARFSFGERGYSKPEVVKIIQRSIEPLKIEEEKSKKRFKQKLSKINRIRQIRRW